MNSALRAKNAVLDGEIVCLDDRGHSQFKSLLYRRGDARFCAFDLLWLNGKDLRTLPLVDRKALLREIIPAGSSSLLYIDHIEGRGEDLFRLACERDLEGIVAKWKRGAYISSDELALSLPLMLPSAQVRGGGWSNHDPYSDRQECLKRFEMQGQMALVFDLFLLIPSLIDLCLEAELLFSKQAPQLLQFWN